MTKKDNENKPDREDKDYGFPFVEVTPIQANIIEEEKEKVGKLKENAVVSEKENPIITEIPKPTEPSIKIKSEKKVSRKAKSQLPLLLSLIFLIVIILGSIAYFLYYIPEPDSPVESTNPIVSEESITEEPLNDEDVILDAELDASESLGKSETESETPLAPISPEGIDAEVIVVDRRGAIPYYNVIVASSPNERIARTEAQKIVDKGRTAWIIFPFGNTNNYRISVGRYEDLESATKAMETIRVEINESSWILKY